VALMVDLGADAPDGSDVVGNAMLVRTRLADLDAALLAELSPDTVIGPLIGRDCDALMLIAQLRALDFRGRIVILSPILPNSTMVERELRVAAGSISIALVERT